MRVTGKRMISFKTEKDLSFLGFKAVQQGAVKETGVHM